MSRLNQLMGDIIRKINPEYASRLIIARHIKREGADKKVIICGSDEEAVQLDMLLRRMGTSGCEYFIDVDAAGQKLNEKPVRAVEDIMYEDTDAIYIAVIASRTMHKIVSRLIEMGYTSEYLHVFCNENIPGGSRLLDVYDANLGFTRRDDLLGFTVFDNGIDAAKPVKTVVALGGSTTDSTFANIMSWPEFLQNMLVERGLNVRVYGGGIAAANSTQELIKCIRDVIPMKPDMVIVYSGINDIKTEPSDTPFILDYQKDIVQKCVDNSMVVNNKAYRNTGSRHKLVLKEAGYGLANHKDTATYWVDNIRMMHAVCEEFGIPFAACLQPNAYTGRGGEISFHRELLDDAKASKYKAITEQIQAQIANIEYITDMTALFNGRMEVYMDDCHVLEFGNKMIAEKMMGRVLKVIDE